MPSRLNRTIKEWKTGELTSEVSVCCEGRPREYVDVRLHGDNGPICLKCWRSTKACQSCYVERAIKGMDICRECWMDDKMPTIEDFAYQRESTEEELPPEVVISDADVMRMRKTPAHLSPQSLRTQIKDSVQAAHDVKMRRVMAGFYRLSDWEDFKGGK